MSGTFTAPKPTKFDDPTTRGKLQKAAEDMARYKANQRNALRHKDGDVILFDLTNRDHLLSNIERDVLIQQIPCDRLIDCCITELAFEFDGTRESFFSACEKAAGLGIARVDFILVEEKYKDEFAAEMDFILSTIDTSPEQSGDQNVKLFTLSQSGKVEFCADISHG